MESSTEGRKRLWPSVLTDIDGAESAIILDSPISIDSRPTSSDANLPIRGANRIVTSSPIASHPPKPQRDDEPLLRIFVFDTQNICSQLFNRQLCSHLNLAMISDPYAVAATVGPDRINTKLKHSDAISKLLERQVAAVPSRAAGITYDIATALFLRKADKMEQKGKVFLAKESPAFIMKHEVMTSSIRHQPSTLPRNVNPTVLPDELLRLVTPVILIRHPALVIPSWLRMANSDGNGCYSIDDEDVTVCTTARWSRTIFDYFRLLRRPQWTRAYRQDSISSPASAPPPPLPPAVKGPFIVDAADVIHNTHATLAMLCRLIGIEAEHVQQSWSPTLKFEKAGEAIKKSIPDNLLKEFSSRLFSSVDGELDRSPSEYNIDLDTETKNWEEEFGFETAKRIRERVEEDLPHYIYLKKMKLRARPSVSVASFSENVSGIPARRRSTVDTPSELKFDDPGSGSPTKFRRGGGEAVLTGGLFT